MILGITGTLGAGKGTVVNYLKSKGFRHYSSSDILKEILTERAHPHTRPYMSALADELMEQHPGGILTLSHTRAKEEGAEDYILEAIHRPSEADYIRRIGGVVLGVDAPLSLRYERSQKRADGAKDAVTLEEFIEHSAREDEGKGGMGPNIRAVLTGADAVLMNEAGLEELHAKIEEALERLRS